jgi:hypothetical protein
MGDAPMKILTLVVCLGLSLNGCGSAGSGLTTNNVMMEGGQWEYAVVPEDGAIPIFIEVNLPGTNGGVAGTNAQFYQPSEDNLPIQSGPIYCGDFNLNGSISGSTLSVKMNSGSPQSNIAKFSGELAANGQSLSNGIYSGGICLAGSQLLHHVQGTLVGYTIPPVSGTFTGTLDSNLYGADVVTVTITQNSDFSLNFAGTSIENGLTTALIANTNAQSSIVNGGTVYLSGSAKNVNGSQPFTIAGHLNPQATQLTIASMSFGVTEYMTGALTKQ